MSDKELIRGLLAVAITLALLGALFLLAGWGINLF